MAYNKCKICNEYHFTDKGCGKIYTVFHDEYLDEDGKQIRGDDFEEVAEKYAEDFNDEGQLFRDSITIEVKNQPGELRKFTISAEPMIYYNIQDFENKKMRK